VRRAVIGYVLEFTFSLYPSTKRRVSASNLQRDAHRELERRAVGLNNREAMEKLCKKASQRCDQPKHTFSGSEPFLRRRGPAGLWARV